MPDNVARDSDVISLVNIQRDISEINRHMSDQVNATNSMKSGIEKLVTIQEARDARELRLYDEERETRRERGSWLRSVFSREVIMSLIAALSGLAVGASQLTNRQTVTPLPTTPSESLVSPDR